MATKKKTLAKPPKKTPKKTVGVLAALKLSPKGRDERYLLILIAASQRAIDGNGSGVDELFQQQVDSLTAELKHLRARK